MDAIEELRKCARRAAELRTPAGFAVAGRLLVKAWELEQAAGASAAAADETSLMEWAAAERARR